MFPELTIFRATVSIPGLFDTLFGGLFLWKGLGIGLQLGFVVCICLSLLCAYRATFRRNPTLGMAANVFGLIGLLFSTLLLVQPWDELFVNLRHPLNFAEVGRFSFNQASNIEGTVDFLPYFLMGLLKRIGLPLIETAFFQSFLGSALCIWAGRALLMAWNFPSARYWAVPVLSLSGPLLLNAGTGFTTTLFCSCILWAVFHCLYGRPLLGTLLLALLPLIRPEGAWFTLLMGFYLLNSREAKKKTVLATLFSFLPIVLLSIWRLKTFGSAIPIPIQYKATPGNPFYMAVGLRNFGTDLIATGTLFWMMAIALTWPSLQRKFAKALWIEGLLILFVLPYYSSGGDWFPPAWGRYLFPLVFFSLLLGIACLTQFFLTVERTPERSWISGALILVFVLHQLPAYGAYHRISEYLFSSRRVLGDVTLKKKRRMNYRIHSLSQTGEHLRRSTLPTDILGTSEIATLSYFSQLETLDFLGLANPEIAKQPLRPRPDLVQTPTEEMDLPHLIFKRVYPELLEKNRPQFLFLFDLQVGDLTKDVPFYEWDDETLRRAFLRWQRSYSRLVHSLYGGFEKMAKLGYQPIIVCYKNEHCSLYFSSKERFQSHSQKLKELGLVAKTYPLR
jgi:hypothetical protein